MCNFNLLLFKLILSMNQTSENSYSNFQEVLQEYIEKKQKLVQEFFNNLEFFNKRNFTGNGFYFGWTRQLLSSWMWGNRNRSKKTKRLQGKTQFVLSVWKQFQFHSIKKDSKELSILIQMCIYFTHYNFNWKLDKNY